MKRMMMNSKQGSKNSKEKSKLRLEDEVVVICGSDRGKRGKILAIDLKKGRVVIQGVRLVKKNPRPTQENPKPSPIQIENPIDISNVMYYDKKNKKRQRLTYHVNGEGDDKKANAAKQRGMKISSERKISILPAVSVSQAKKSER